MKSSCYLLLVVTLVTSDCALSQRLPFLGTYRIEKLLPLCVPDYPEQAKADTLVGQSIEFGEDQIIFNGFSHRIDSLRSCAFREGEYHDAHCDSVNHPIRFKDFEDAERHVLVVEYVLTFNDGFNGPGNHLLDFNDFENIVIGFKKYYYKLKAVDLPSDFSIDFTGHRGWKKVNDSLFVLKDFEKEFNGLYTALSQGHQPWRWSPRFAAAACFWEFGIYYKFTNVFLFGARLTKIKEQEIYSVEVGGRTYLLHLKMKKGIPVPYRLEINNRGGI